MLTLAISAALALGLTRPATTVTTWSLNGLFSTYENIPTNRFYYGYTNGFGGKFTLLPYTAVNSALYSEAQAQGYSRGWSVFPNNIQPPAIIKNTDLTITDSVYSTPVPPQTFIFIGPSGQSYRPCIRFRVAMSGKHHLTGTINATNAGSVDFRIFLYRNGTLSFLNSKTVTLAGGAYNFDFYTPVLDPATDIIEFATGNNYALVTAKIETGTAP
ncbi:hypothetical protein [Fimbriimonas ginsengisoli]|uniref:Uncharacterized protein n=1 Tax=Fimbriimonas ginsengisoli Gsoil 348 TaxID=661478 RepID=A0A068NXF0_FIMGI|nr:hypothetical protein [Fimbriimonas ginsengisoli]AIE88091.1 hypothetical protein OP10G_4723 [Fimbriimonas ginsengisoli Gsoil 348]